MDDLSIAVLEHSSDAITILAVKEESFQFTYANPAAKNLGVPDDRLGKTVEEVYPPELASQLIELYTRVLRTLEPELLEGPFIRPSGTIIGTYKVIPLKDKQGQYKHLLTIATDETEQIREHNKAEQSEKIIESIYNSSNEAMVIMDINSRVIRVNQLFLEIFGYAEMEIKGSSLREISYVPEHLRHEAIELLERVARGEQIRTYRTQRCSKQGECIDVSINFLPIFDENGQVFGIMASYRDKREKLQQEKVLRESEERYRKLFELTPDALVIYRDGEILRVNQASLKLVGADSSQEIVGKHIMQFIHPSNWQTVQERMSVMKTTGENLKTVELKLIRLDGSIITIGVHTALITIDGTDCVLSICRDITERKAVEEELRESREKYKLIAQNMKDLIGVFDPGGIMTYASPSYETMLGIAPFSLVGKSIVQVVHPEDVRILMGKFQQLLINRAETNAEIRFLHADGNEVMVEATGSIIENERGEIANVLIVARDIRERKRFEGQLKELAFYDALTGLPNRRYFEDHFARALPFAKRYGHDLALLYLDLDGFKNVNDTLGHAAGDEVLVKFSTAIRDCLRQSDLFARLGGDEFVILLTDCNEQDIISVSNKILQAVQLHCSVVEENLTVGTSIGISMFTRDGETIEELLKCADDALYRAKAAGKNQYVFYGNDGESVGA